MSAAAETNVVACSEGVEAYTNAQIGHVNAANEQNEAQLNSNLEADRQVLLFLPLFTRRSCLRAAAELWIGWTQPRAR
jgi:hypothetical protein